MKDQITVVVNEDQVSSLAIKISRLFHEEFGTPKDGQEALALTITGINSMKVVQDHILKILKETYDIELGQAARETH